MTESMDNDGFFKRYGAVWPTAAGLSLAYLGLTAAVSTDFCGVDSTLFNDGAAAAAIIAALIVALVIHRVRRVFDDAVWRRLAIGSIGCESASVVAVAALHYLDAPDSAVFVACTVTCACALTAGASWLRRARGAGAVTVTVLVFSAMALSETLLLAASFLPETVRCIVIIPLVLAQIPFARMAATAGEMPRTAALVGDYYAFMLAGSASRRFLVTSAIGLACIAVVSGFLCGLPGDSAVSDAASFRIARWAATLALCAGFIVFTIRQRTRAMTIGIWVLMELLAAASLVLFAAFHENPAPSAFAADLLFAMMTAFVWHLIVAFLSLGRLDALTYAIAIWGINVIPHGIGRVAVEIMPVHGATHITGSIVSLLLLISTQIVFLRLIDIARFASAQKSESPAEDDGREPLNQIEAQDNEEAPMDAAIERLLGINEESAVDVSRAAMRRCAERMGQHFMLSEREIEVLALWAAGFTQKRVAEKLHVSPTTAHTHISRIYAKCGMHSRQEIIDFMHRYLDE